MSPNLSPLFRHTAVALTIVIAVAGCGLVGKVGRGDLSDELSFSFDRTNGQGYMDQTLAIVSETRQRMVIKAAVAVFDESGEVLPDVQVRSVYGALVANMVIGPGENIDVLIFDGPGATAVHDVRVLQVDAIPVDASAWEAPVDAVPLDGDGVPLDYPAGYSKVTLENPNGESADVRVVAIVWNNPETGETQQAQDVIELSQLITVPPGGKIVIDVEQSMQDLISGYAGTNALSVKAYYAL
ncbi:hypothetical protein [Myceligenerans xiligouense]|uniref:Uncharacterized protein n=1 Tax=Myceligenerans xiligouense TaxID=253184 RepID=A0A3N4ZPI8_9MICO|nr:hypothetical protein [Myceligenerans xiligouense]RPF21751.1 hypothetical protein EDD34_2386 [Myceligenerans xiligouense]